MKLTYQTGIAALVQFVSMTFFGVPNALVSIIETCTHQHSDCVSNAIVSIIFFLLTAAWFGFIWLLGFVAQERRSSGLARLLIFGEILTAGVAIFNIRHDSNYLTRITSLLDILLAAWIIVLAFRLSRAKGSRIRTPANNRARHRIHRT